MNQEEAESPDLSSDNDATQGTGGDRRDRKSRDSSGRRGTRGERGPGGRGGHRRDHRGGRGGRHGRRRGRGDLRTAVLVLLAEQPRHGYELMKEVAERTSGSWRPSPGSIYPTLQGLQDEGLVRIEHDDSGRGIAHLTEEGEKSAAELIAESDAIWEDASGHGSGAQKELWVAHNEFVRALKQVSQVGTPTQVEQAAELVSTARRSLYGILAEDPTS
ncbi:MAG: PadR family transcriptional regulator [Actinobacteria bacterium]|nr:PadR family transcriptional regulator [Actinomycetota bacterium]